MTAANRGPAAAVANRAALLASGRRLFAEQGYAVPLSAIARDAGVGQGSLYRHFPTRAALAAAIVEETMATLREVAGAHGTRDGRAPDGAAFAALWSTLIDDLVDATGFLSSIFTPHGGLDGRQHAEALTALLRAPLADAQASGRVDPELTLADVMLVIDMVFGATQGGRSRGERRECAERACRLVGRGLALE